MSCHRPVRLAVLASGSGSNLQAILDACAAGELRAQVVGVYSDRRGAYALERAENARVPHVRVHPAPEVGESRVDWDEQLAAVISECDPDWIVLAGFMRVLSTAFLSRFPNRVINLHPALPGELAGARAIERAYREFQDGLRTSTGVMVHLVPDEGVDSGPLLAVVEVPIYAADSLDALVDRMRTAEHQLIVSTLQRLVADTPLGERP